MHSVSCTSSRKRYRKSNIRRDAFPTYYGIGRDMDADGGCVAVITCEEENEIKQEYEDILQKYHIRIDEREFRDILCTDDEGEYYSDLYIVTNDFGVTIIWYHKERA